MARKREGWKRSGEGAGDMAEVVEHLPSNRSFNQKKTHSLSEDISSTCEFMTQCPPRPPQSAQGTTRTG
jgi:hypothetical protein